MIATVTSHILEVAHVNRLLFQEPPSEALKAKRATAAKKVRTSTFVNESEQEKSCGYGLTFIVDVFIQLLLGLDNASSF